MNDIPPTKPGYLERDKKVKKEEKALVTYDQVRMSKNVALGTAGIDPADVMPVQVKLVQGSSDFSKLIDESGTQAKVGQYFFMGDKSIHETVKCYVLSLAKVNDPFNPRDDGSFEKMYRMIAVFDDLKTPFTMNFRRGAIYTIKSLISNVFSQKRGVYTFKIELSYEQRKGKEGNYLVPVVKIIKNEDVPEILNMLERGAQKYEYLSKIMGDEDLMVKRAPKTEIEPIEEPVDETKKLGESVNPDDIPF